MPKRPGLCDGRGRRGWLRRKLGQPHRTSESRYGLLSRMRSKRLSWAKEATTSCGASRGVRCRVARGDWWMQALTCDCPNKW